MKQRVKLWLQRLLGFDNYLFLFALFVILTLRWNKKERDFLHFLQMIPDGYTVLDIGANIGIMSVWFSRQLPHTHILAFEPVPYNAKALRKVLQFCKAKNVEVIQKALGNVQGTAEMVMPQVENVPMQGLSHVVHASITELNEGQRFLVPMIQLDKCEHIKTADKIAAIKIDVENFEYFVLSGATQTLTRYKPLVYAELWDNENRSRCLDLMKSLGYQVKVLQNRQLVAFEPAMHRTQNFFFVHPDHQHQTT